MCGRFIQIADPQRVRAYIGEAEVEPGVSGSFTPSYNVAPTREVLAVLNTSPPRITLLRWGLIPFWTKDGSQSKALINARAETLETRPSFREPFRRRRCMIFADGFYEWDKKSKPKTPYLVRMRDRQPFAMAGLWDEWTDRTTNESVRSCTIVTTEANGIVSPIHDRMPAILRPESYPLWLAVGASDPAALKGVLAPYPQDLMEAFAVSMRMNDPAFDSPECMEPARG